MAKVFEPFFIIRSKSAGLGLVIVKRILDQHHAVIRLLNSPQGGTCVSVVQPVTPQTAPSGATA